MRQGTLRACQWLIHSRHSRRWTMGGQFLCLRSAVAVDPQLLVHWSLNTSESSTVAKAETINFSLATCARVRVRRVASSEELPRIDFKIHRVMDAADADNDAKLYKASGALLQELNYKLPVLVWHPGKSPRQLRQRVLDSKCAELMRLVSST